MGAYESQLSRLGSPGPTQPDADVVDVVLPLEEEDDVLELGNVEADEVVNVDVVVDNTVLDVCVVRSGHSQP